MINFCSYFDKNYLGKFLILRDSLIKLRCKHNFYVLPLDDYSLNFLKDSKLKYVTYCKLNQLEERFIELKKIKNERSNIEYYFTLSPYLPIFFQEKFGLQRLNYLDVDIFFFKNPKLFYNLIKKYSIILIKQNFNTKYGNFNVGWISYNFLHKDTIKILNNWKIKCAEWCYDKVEENRYADQKYLDEWPKFSKDLIICDPKFSMSSPWDCKKDYLVKNNNKFYCYHFQGLKFSTNFFFSGIGLYHYNFHRNFIKNFYLKYIFLLKKKQVEKNLEFINNSQLRSELNIKKKWLDLLFSFLKKIKFILILIFRRDFYKIN